MTSERDIAMGNRSRNGEPLQPSQYKVNITVTKAMITAVVGGTIIAASSLRGPRPDEENKQKQRS